MSYLDTCDIYSWNLITWKCTYAYKYRQAYSTVGHAVERLCLLSRKAANVNGLCSNHRIHENACHSITDTVRMMGKALHLPVWLPEQGNTTISLSVTCNYSISQSRYGSCGVLGVVRQLSVNQRMYSWHTCIMHMITGEWVWLDFLALESRNSGVKASTGWIKY